MRGRNDTALTFNNRLLEYRIFDVVDPNSPVLLRTVRYTYWTYGHVRDIAIKDEWVGQGDPPAEYAKEYDLAMQYRTSGQPNRAVHDRGGPAAALDGLHLRHRPRPE
jgi:hypothetical protein